MQLLGPYQGASMVAQPVLIRLTHPRVPAGLMTLPASVQLECRLT